MSNYIFMIHYRGSRPVYFAPFYMFTVHDPHAGTGHYYHVINMLSFCAPQEYKPDVATGHAPHVATFSMFTGHDSS